MPFLKVPPLFKDLKPSAQFLLFLCFCVLFFVFFGVLSVFLVGTVFDLPAPGVGLEAGQINQYKWIQLLTSVGIFMLPPILLSSFFNSSRKEFLGFHKSPKNYSFFLSFLILLFTLPILNFIIEWNESIQLPASFQALEEAIRGMEEDAEILTKMFLKAESVGMLLANLLLIAVVPAVGEELLFRGVFQQLLAKIFRNKHAGIWAAAFLFSLMHMQFYGFVPRMLLGALFGYLFVWSGSLWIPIFAHFMNNGSAVLLSYFTKGTSVQQEIDSIGTDQGSIFYLAPSALALYFLLKLFYTKNNKKIKPSETH